MVQKQLYTAQNGIIINFNTSDNTVNISVLKSFIDNVANSLMFNSDFFDVLPFENNYVVDSMSKLVFNTDIILDINGVNYYTSACFPNCFFFDSLIVGLKNNPIIPIEIMGNGVNITNTQTQEAIFNFDVVASGITYQSNYFYANNEYISIFHKFNQNQINSAILQFEILICVNSAYYTWELDIEDKLDIFLLVYDNLTPSSLFIN